MDTKKVISALSALAQDTRLAIFRLLIAVGQNGMMVGAIGEKLNIPHATLSFHLDKLDRAGLIVSRREGRATIYSANFDAFVGTIRYLTEDCCKDSEHVSCQIIIKDKKEAN